MSWLELAGKEWRRRPLRSTLAASGVAVAVATLFALLSFQRGYKRGVRLELERLGAHVLVVPKGCPYNAASIALHGASWPCYLRGQYLQEVRATPGVASAAPVFMSASYDSAGRQTVYVGIDTNMLLLKPQWKIRGTFPEKSGDLLVGSDAAQRRNWQVGQAVKLSAVAERAGLVCGTLGITQGPDDTFIFMRLADAQQWFKHPGELTHILVRLRDPNELEKVVSQLRGCDAGQFMNVVPMAHLFETIRSVVNSTGLLLACLTLVAALIAATGVSNAVLMAVSERTREIGVLRAIGASQLQVFQLFWLEAFLISLAGALAGIAVAFLCAQSLEGWLRARLPFAPTETLVRWDMSIVGLCAAAALILGTLAGLLPAWRAIRLSPLEAMRQHGHPT